jgi:ubiquinone/menaquinone biosynthesis C-methylase UbiE/DNA-binding MarR family transcriptional regulator
MQDLLTALKAAAEPTRLRLLALCAHADLTVSDLTQILGQSQPRISRHLKLLADAGLLDRIREGNWVYFRLSGRGAAAELGRILADALPDDDAQINLDLARLDAIRQVRAAKAEAYFRRNASRWDEIRALYVAEEKVEQVFLDLLPAERVHDLLDVGTGTGRILELLAPRTRHAIGLDLSREMLAVARAKLDKAGLRNCELRQGDMYHLPLPPSSVDAVTFHQVLHFGETPAEAIAEAARVLRPGGRLLVADFAAHDLETLRTSHAHRWLGFDDAKVRDWFLAAGLAPGEPVTLPGVPLTVMVWSAEQPATIN